MRTMLICLATILALTASAGCTSPDAGKDPDPTTLPNTEQSTDANTTHPEDTPLRDQPPLRSSADQRHLWIALFTGIPEDRIATFLPDGVEPARCFQAPYPEHEVVYFVTEDTYHELPGLPARPLHQIQLATCVDAPAGWLLEDANEPDWFTLAHWTDDAAYHALLSERGHSVRTMTYDGGGPDDAIGFEARDDQGRLLGAGAFATPATAAPPPFDFVDCEPDTMTGRALSHGTQGRIHALDWHKQEATCLAGGTLGWDEATLVGEILGTSDGPDWAFRTFVDEAEYAWHVLG